MSAPGPQRRRTTDATGGRRHCQGCGTVLAADNTARLCSRCHREQRDQLRTPPAQLGNEFFETDQFRAAFQSRHMGRVFVAYRNHPRHLNLFGKALNQETLGRWLGLTQAQVSKIEHSSRPETRLDVLINWAKVLQLPSNMLWFDMPNQSRFANNHQDRQESSSIDPLILALPSPWTPDYVDADYLHTINCHIDQIVSLDNRFGGADLSRLAERFFRTIHNQIGSGAFEPAIRRDLLATAGELAEVAGWLAYDADRQDSVRRMNQEALYFTRLAGDRSMELLTLQNASMHAGFLNNPREALDIAQMVLSGEYKLSPRLRALFLTRKARALAQCGDPAALGLFDEVRSLYQDGTTESDPKWAWWIDERELAWHEAMCQQDLGNSKSAIAQFEHSVQVTPAAEIRSQYVHRAYLLNAQISLRSWDAATRTMREILPLATEVGSTRTVVLLRRTLNKLNTTETNIPSRVLEHGKHLGRALVLAPI